MLIIEELDYTEDVFDITVEDNHNFFANGILVHNCTEITLYSDNDHTFTCVLASMNLAKYNEWKDTDAIFTATVFLDCVASEFIKKAKGTPGLEKAIRFTEKGRALGLGTCGYHTYLQQESIPFESFEAHMFNNRFFKELHDKSLEASQWMAKELGEPEWCKGYGVRNTHRTAIAPTMSCTTSDTKFRMADGSVINYEEFLSRAGLNYSSMTKIKVEGINGEFKEYNYDEKINVLRMSNPIEIYACNLQAGDEIV